MLIKKTHKLITRMKLYTKWLLSKPNKDFNHFNRSNFKIVVALAADYGNLGDVAITYAQTEFLKAKFPDADIIDFPISKTFTEVKSLKKIINKNDIITIVGGGNTGDMYDDIEYCRQFIISQFPENKIISFPQTIDFSNTNSGKKALQRATKIYGKHKGLTLSAREQNSFNMYKEHFLKNNIVYSPDIVLSLEKQYPCIDREGIIFCLRKDGEKRINKEEESSLIEEISKKYSVTYYDTHINKNNLSIEERENELYKIWTAFKKSKIVLTDRLHGMIFCAITKTPCIALDNSNHKISGVYKAWLKDLDYIIMLENNDIEEIQKNIEYLWSYDMKDHQDMSLIKKFEPLMKSI
ncbi:polysaccharide pyruvyl transferase family protein [Salirhabdus salicampi]|uniref:polysaccharide pyruvyl transferase family protein n=1 Tax=Salirhabdus salicampi TaxID=476102 RepID=UPI0020C211C9|nr:polysaccharide pyruvyl transferase family protein [Salirhabdus salicampi]MCP8617526.1 polysaccharide pyruvyl transferase family protein [Salirhabdus salicampi]